MVYKEHVKQPKKEDYNSKSKKSKNKEAKECTEKGHQNPFGCGPVNSGSQLLDPNFRIPTSGSSVPGLFLSL